MVRSLLFGSGELMVLPFALGGRRYTQYGKSMALPWTVSVATDACRARCVPPVIQTMASFRFVQHLTTDDGVSRAYLGGKLHPPALLHPMTQRGQHADVYEQVLPPCLCIRLEELVERKRRALARGDNFATLVICAGNGDCGPPALPNGIIVLSEPGDENRDVT